VQMTIACCILIPVTFSLIYPAGNRDLQLSVTNLKDDNGYQGKSQKENTSS
jgi:hypothetical protein